VGLYTELFYGVVEEAMVLQWEVRTAPRETSNLEKKVGALLSGKRCCFVRKPSWKSRANLN